MKREHIFAGFILLIIVSGFAWRQTRTTEATLKDLTWKPDAPTFIVQKEAKQNAYTGPMLIRLQDGKDQFISGDWTLHFSGSGLFGYGNFAKSTSTTYTTSTNIFSTSTGPFVMEVDDKVISVIEIKNIDGQAVDGSNSINGSYIGVRTTGDKAPYCVIETTEDRKLRTCDPVPVEKDDHVIWNPGSDHELIVSSATGSLSTIDVWEKEKMKKTYFTKEENQKQYKALLAAFPKTKPDAEIKRWWNVLAIQSANGWKTFNIPSSAHISLLSDQDHVLIQEENALSLLEVSTRKRATLYTKDKIGEQKILTRNSEIDSL